MNATPLPPTAGTPDLDACAREPIHVPGAIQPHGMLLALREPERTIAQVSTNVCHWLGLTPPDLLGREVSAFLSGEDARRIAQALALDEPGHASPLLVTAAGRRFEALLHRHRGASVIELEPAPDETENFARHHRRLQGAMAAMQQAADVSALYGLAARAMADLTGYERVMVYHFAADWHGEVVGEALSAEVDSYLGLHFPASDIPEQARALYASNWLRIIPDVGYQPVPLEPARNPVTGEPLDLSFSVLRSVSPVHLEYLRNMNVGASMSISLLVEGRLWGLIACHHRTPRHLPYAVRAACELFGQVVSREIAAKETSRRLADRAEVRTIQTRFFDVIAREENFAEALLRYTPGLLDFMGADGVAIALGEQCHLVGLTPPREAVQSLLAWLAARPAEEPVFSTDSLSAHWPPGAEMTARASGLLAVKLSRVAPHWVLWFRPEMLTTLTWAGNPEKPVEAGLRLHPRKSFAAWQQTVRGRSKPWQEAEIQGAHELRLAMNALVIRRTERLLKLNAELERKNSDLNSFAYIASHDLKEPLRGIRHFATFLREDHGEALGGEGLRKIDTIIEMTGHTHELLEALGRYSRLGRMELVAAEADLDAVVTEVETALAAPLREARAEIRRPRRPLPAVACDRVLMREVFANLIANALKYNERAEKWVEISYRDPDPEQAARGPIFTVRDNGIGIRERNYDSAFRMFRRLNKEKFGPGSGTGLAIVKSIVERHGGRIWIESVFGEGTTFLFTLK